MGLVCFPVAEFPELLVVMAILVLITAYFLLKVAK
jgi:hypothetical protein